MQTKKELREELYMLYMLVDALASEYLYKSGLIAPTQEEKGKIIKLICKNRGFNYDRLFR